MFKSCSYFLSLLPFQVFGWKESEKGSKLYRMAEGWASEKRLH
jgi:hypothetical protein